MTDKNKTETAPKEPKKMVIDKERRKTYQRADEKTASGSKVIDKGDPIAVALRAVSKDGVDALVDIAKENGDEVLARLEKYIRGKLNPGQIRMNFGNILRGMYNKGEVVMIQGKSFHDKEAKARREAANAEQKAAKKVVKADKKK